MKFQEYFILKLPEILIAVLTGLLVAIIIYLFQRILSIWKNRKHSKLAGKYKVFRKTDVKREHQIAKNSIHVKGNKLVVKGKRLSDGMESIGTIEMNETMPEYGTGFYRNVDEKSHGWGFYEIQVKSSDKILVHSPYQKGDGTMVHQALFWFRENE